MSVADALHGIRAEKLDVEIASEALAIALQPRIGDLNRQRLLPVIERVLGEFDHPGRHVRIDRLAVDLGVLPLNGLEQSAEAALYETLHQALRDAIGGEWETYAARADEPSARGLVALLAHYLQHGTLPFWAATMGVQRSSFAAQDLVQTLLVREPAALADLIRHAGRDPQVLERLVLQLDESMLQDLLRLIEPEHAALILAYMLDLRVIHRAEPMLSLDDDAFERLLWTLAFSYLLRDAGSQFNRKSFVVAILARTSESEGIDYRILLATLARGLRTTMRHLPLASSLPAVIAEIARDLGVASEMECVAEPAPSDAEESTSTDPAALAAMVRRYGSDRRMLERLVSQLDEAMLQAVLRLLDPIHAALVISYLLDLRRVHHAAPLLVRGEDGFRQLLWVLTLSYFSRDAGSQFNRKSFTRALLDGIARDEEVGYETLLTALAEGLRVTAARRPLGSSLPAVIEELSHEMPPESSAAPDAAGLIAERYERLDAFRHYLRHGVLPLDVLLRRPDWSAETLLADLAKLGPAQLSALLERTSSNLHWPALLHLVRMLSADTLAELVGRLLPAARAEGPLRAAIDAAVSSSPHPDIFYARLIAALLEGGDLDFEAMVSTTASPAPKLLDDPITWPAPRLAAALLAGLRDDGADGPNGWAVLLDAFVSRHRSEARLFFRIVAASSECDTMLARIPAQLFGRVLALMCPTDGQAIEVMLAAIRELPISERPGSDAAMRRAILFEVLRVGAIRDAGVDFLARVLRAVFGGVPPATAGDRLRKAYARAALPEESRAALIAAQKSGQKEGAAAEAEAPVVRLRDALFDWLRGIESGHADALPLDVLLAVLPEIAAAFPDALRNFLMQHAGRPELRERWAKMLPESALARLVEVFEPRQVRLFVDSAELLHEAAAEAASDRHEPAPPRAAMWSGLFAYLAATPVAQRSTEGLLAGILARSPENEERLRETARRLAEAGGRQGLIAALARSRDTTRRSNKAPAPRETPRVRPARARTAFSLSEKEAADAEPVYIDNAGLVLAGAFLPHLFRSLDLLAQDEAGSTRMRDHDAASRAVHLVQYLADGRCDAPEPLLVLNKIMCGVPTDAPVMREIVPAEREREMCDSLLTVMIARWEIIRDSSVEALRETFLRREGRLVRKAESWELRVDRKTVDVLVDRVPWNIGLVFNAWMPHPLHVTW